MVPKKALKFKKANMANLRHGAPIRISASSSIARIGVAALLLLPVLLYSVYSFTNKQTVIPTPKIEERPVPSVDRTDVISLPTKPRSFDTKTEQEQLLSRVEQLVTAYPQSVDAMHIAAITYSELLQTDKAMVFFGNALTLDASSTQLLIDYAKLLLQMGKQQAAVDLLESAPDSALSADVIDLLGNAYMQLGELDNAAETLIAGLKRAPLDSSIHLRLAQVQLQQQHFEEAEKNSRAAIQLGLTTNAAYTTLSSALNRLGRREEALAIRGKTVQTNPQAETNDEHYKQSFQHFAAHTYALLGGVYRANGQVAAAEEALQESISIDPNAVPSLVALGDLYYTQRRATQAIEVYRRLVDAQPENLYNFNNLASLALSTGNLPLAEDSLRRAGKADPTGNATLRLADFLLRLGNFTEATIQAESAVKQLGNGDAYLVWISALKADGKMGAAMSALIRAREVIPGDDRLKNIQL